MRIGCVFRPLGSARSQPPRTAELLVAGDALLSDLVELLVSTLREQEEEDFHHHHHHQHHQQQGESSAAWLRLEVRLAHGPILPLAQCAAVPLARLGFQNSLEEAAGNDSPPSETAVRVGAGLESGGSRGVESGDGSGRGGGEPLLVGPQRSEGEERRRLGVGLVCEDCDAAKAFAGDSRLGTTNVLIVRQLLRVPGVDDLRPLEVPDVGKRGLLHGEAADTVFEEWQRAHQWLWPTTRAGSLSYDNLRSSGGAPGRPGSRPGSRQGSRQGSRPGSRQGCRPEAPPTLLKSPGAQHFLSSPALRTDSEKDVGLSKPLRAFWMALGSVSHLSRGRAVPSDYLLVVGAPNTSSWRGFCFPFHMQFSEDYPACPPRLKLLPLDKEIALQQPSAEKATEATAGQLFVPSSTIRWLEDDPDRLSLFLRKLGERLFPAQSSGYCGRFSPLAENWLRTRCENFAIACSPLCQGMCFDEAPPTLDSLTSGPALSPFHDFAKYVMDAPLGDLFGRSTATPRRKDFKLSALSPQWKDSQESIDSALEAASVPTDEFHFGSATSARSKFYLNNVEARCLGTEICLLLLNRASAAYLAKFERVFSLDFASAQFFLHESILSVRSPALLTVLEGLEGVQAGGIRTSLSPWSLGVTNFLLNYLYGGLHGVLTSWIPGGTFEGSSADRDSLGLDQESSDHRAVLQTNLTFLSDAEWEELEQLGDDLQLATLGTVVSLLRNFGLPRAFLPPPGGEELCSWGEMFDDQYWMAREEFEDLALLGFSPLEIAMAWVSVRQFEEMAGDPDKEVFIVEECELWIRRYRFEEQRSGGRLVMRVPPACDALDAVNREDVTELLDTFYESREELATDFLKLYNGGGFAPDVVLEASDDERQVRVHRSVVIARSTYFYTLLVHGWNDSPSQSEEAFAFPTILGEGPYLGLEACAEYFYTDRLNDDADVLVPLLEVQDMYGPLPRLRLLVEITMAERLQEETAVPVLALARRYSAPVLERAARSFLLQMEAWPFESLETHLGTVEAERLRMRWGASLRFVSNGRKRLAAAMENLFL